MPSVLGQNVLPGIYTTVEKQLLPSTTGGVRVAAFIGTGTLFNSVTNESVTRGSGNVDSLSHTATSLASTILDSNFASYINNDDYRLSGTFHIVSVTDGTHLVVDNTTGLNPGDTIVQGSHNTTITTVTDTTHLIVGSTTGFVAGLVTDTTEVQGKVLWLLAPAFIIGTTSAPYADQNGNTFSFKVGSNPITTVTFSGVTTSLASVVSQINTFYGDTIASANGSSLELSTGTLGTPVLFNDSITIENGTSNSALGFIAGSFVETPQRPALGVIYYVSYQWAKVLGDSQNSFQPQFFFTQNFSSITNVYGAVGGGADGQFGNMLADNTNYWTLPLAATIAQQNGASIVCMLQMNPADGSGPSQVRSALTKLSSTAGVNLVISMYGQGNAMLIGDITDYVATVSSTINRMEETAFIGFATTDPSATNLNTMLGYATEADSNRVVVVNQNNVSYQMFIGTNTTASTVDGTIVAAALAGLRTNPAYDVAQPLTRMTLSGVTTSNTLTQAAKVILSNQGVLVIDTISGVPKVVFGTTTDYADILDTLYQVTTISDYTTQQLRGLLDPIFIGQSLTTNTPTQVQTVTSAILQTIQNAGIIVSFTSPQTTVIGTTINLSVGIQPTLELDIVFITLGLNLQ